MSGVRIGVCGLGPIGSRHARLLGEVPGVSVHVYDAGTRRPAPGGVPGGVQVAESFLRLLDAGLDGLIVATGESARAGQAIAACERGIPVLIEKPVADAVAAATELGRIATDRAVPVLVGYAARHGAPLRLVQQMLSLGEIGRPMSAHASHAGPPDPAVPEAASTYRLPYHYSQVWDYLQWLFGSARGAAAVATSPVGGPADRPATASSVDGVLDLDGIAATFHIDGIGAPGAGEAGTHELTVVGDEGLLRADIREGTIMVRTRRGERRYDRAESGDAPLVRQLNHFVAVTRRSEDPQVTVLDGIRALRVADAVVAGCAERSWQPVRAS